MQRTKPRVRITVSLDASTARMLDDQRRGRRMNRSEAVEEAIVDWLRRRIEGDRSRITGLSEGLDDQTRLLERATRVATETVLEALFYQFPHLGEFSGTELRRRAQERLLREGWGR